MHTKLCSNVNLRSVSYGAGAVNYPVYKERLTRYCNLVILCLCSAKIFLKMPVEINIYKGVR